VAMHKHTACGCPPSWGNQECHAASSAKSS
jgi:hypothetical protein